MTPLRRSALSLERLEARAVPAFTSTLSGTTATMIGSATNDSITISVSGGLLAHDRGSDPGFAGDTDWDSSVAGVQSISATAAATLNINLGDGADSLNFSASAVDLTVNVHGGNGNDTFTVSATSGGAGTTLNLYGDANDNTFNINGVGPATFGVNIYGGTGINQAVLAPASSSIAVTYTNATGGTVTYSAGNSPALSYFGLEYVKFITTPANLTFNLPSGAAATLGDDGGPGDLDGTNNVNASFISGPDITATQFDNPASSLTVTLSNGGGTLTMNTMDAAFAPTSGSALNGGSGNDTITVIPINNSAIAVNGNGPATLPGDALNMPTLTVNPGLGTPSGTIGKLTYQGIERVNAGFTDTKFAVGADAGSTPTVAYYNADGSQRLTTLAFASTFKGGVRVATGDFNGDGIPDVVVGTGPGGPTQVRILDGTDGHELFSIAPFEAAFTGGVYVAAGDITGDGVPELVITPDQGGGPRVRIFNGVGFTPLADFLGINDPSFRGGARTAVGDITGDGIGDLVVAAGFGGGPRVTGYDGTTVLTASRSVLFNFFMFEQTLRNGAFIATGDLNGDGHDDLIGGGGPGGGPRVYALSGIQIPSQGANATVLANFYGGDVNSRGGIRVAAAHLDGDNKADLIAGAGAAAGSRVTTYLGSHLTPNGTPTAALNFNAFGTFNGGVFVG